MQRKKVETELKKYRVVQDRLLMSDFDKYILELEENAKKKYLNSDRDGEIRQPNSSRVYSNSTGGADEANER